MLRLSLGRQPLADLSVLERFPALTALSLAGVKAAAERADAIAGCVYLEELDLSGVPISDLRCA